MTHYSRVSTATSKTYSVGAAVLPNELLNGSISLFIALLRTKPDTRRTRIAIISVPTAPGAEYTLLAKSKCAGPPSLVRSTGRLTRPVEEPWSSPDAWKLSIPSILYVIQNNLQFVAGSNLDVAAFQVTYQMKILTTAEFIVLMSRRRPSTVKLLSLLGLAIGVGVVQIRTGVAAHGGSSGGDLVACVTSGLAGTSTWLPKERRSLGRHAANDSRARGGEDRGCGILGELMKN